MGFFDWLSGSDSPGLVSLSCPGCGTQVEVASEGLEETRCPSCGLSGKELRHHGRGEGQTSGATSTGTAPSRRVEEMTGEQFEDYLSHVFRGLGYHVEATPSSNDQGADLIVSDDGDRLVVEAKRHDNPVGNSAVQAVSAARNHYGADRALVVATSSFTDAARELAETNDVRLVGGAELSDLVLGRLALFR